MVRACRKNGIKDDAQRQVIEARSKCHSSANGRRDGAAGDNALSASKDFTDHDCTGLPCGAEGTVLGASDVVIAWHRIRQS